MDKEEMDKEDAEKYRELQAQFLLDTLEKIGVEMPLPNGSIFQCKKCGHTWDLNDVKGKHDNLMIEPESGELPRVFYCPKGCSD